MYFVLFRNIYFQNSCIDFHDLASYFKIAVGMWHQLLKITNCWCQLIFWSPTIVLEVINKFHHLYSSHNYLFASNSSWDHLSSFFFSQVEHNCSPLQQVWLQTVFHFRSARWQCQPLLALTSKADAISWYVIIISFHPYSWHPIF